MTGARSTSSARWLSVGNLRPERRRRLADLRAASPAPNHAFEIGSIVAGTSYRVLALLGVGGMGSVYEVEHVELGKRFVLKALLSELSGREDLAQRLRNEQRALGRLEHPNIVTVTDAGVASSGVPFFVMERLEGETLGGRVRRLGRLPVAEVLGVAEGVLDGLAAAHAIGVVHRDIKPQNVFLVGGVRPKLLDFGVAKFAAAGNVITARGVAVGTPRYMSPEQASGEAVDGRSDLYAVGLLLFEGIAGRGPFDDLRDANGLLLAHLARPAPRVSAAVPGVADEVDELVAGLLAKKPSARPPTARAAAEALRAVARRQRASAELEAATPRVGYAVTTRLFSIPVARDEHSADDAPTLVRVPCSARLDDTCIDDRTSTLTNTRARTTPLHGSPELAPAVVAALSFRRGLLWRALWITLAGAGMGVAALGLLVALFRS